MKTREIVPEKLDEILEQEYVALLSGDLENIAKTGAEKVQFLERVSKLPMADLRKFHPLAGSLMRNHVLTQSAIAGMRSAVHRTKEVNDVTKMLRTYGSDGRKSDLAMHAGRTLSKRS